jgi:uncharacterized membrane protein YidH (DUF202 family)
MIVLQAAMATGILFLSSLKMFLILIPILTTILSLLAINRNKSDELSKKFVLHAILKSFGISIIIIFILATVFILFLFFGIDLSDS